MNAAEAETADQLMQVEDDQPEEGRTGSWHTGETGSSEKLYGSGLPEEEETDRVYAGFFARLTAWLLDRFIIGIPILIVRMVTGLVSLGISSKLWTKDILFTFSPADIVYYLIGAAYFVIFTYMGGRTIGKRIMKLCVVSADENRKPTLFEIVFRETFGRFLSAFILCLGYLMIVVGDEKQALHDYLADTRVVYSVDKQKTM